MHQKYMEDYYAHPKRCKVCGSVIPYESRTNVTCSVACRSKILGGARPHNGYGKGGSYKGIHCDSTYELAFLIYCLDHKIDIVRNKESFEYHLVEDLCYTVHRYYPDFYLPEYDTFIEIKGRHEELVDIKLEAVKKSGKHIEILYQEDLEFAFTYVQDNYPVKINSHSNNLYVLYDMQHCQFDSGQLLQSLLVPGEETER